MAKRSSRWRDRTAARSGAFPPSRLTRRPRCRAPAFRSIVAYYLMLPETRQQLAPENIAAAKPCYRLLRDFVLDDGAPMRNRFKVRRESATHRPSA